VRKKPRSLVVSAHETPSKAEAALEGLEALASEKVVRLADVAIVVKTESGRVELHQHHDVSVGEGLVGGGVAGVMAGLVFGFPIAVAAAGLAAGAAFGAFDRGIDDGRMRRLGAELRPGQAALCALVEDADWAILRERMAPFAGELLVAELTPEAEAELRAVEERRPA